MTKGSADRLKAATAGQLATAENHVFQRAPVRGESHLLAQVFRQPPCGAHVLSPPACAAGRFRVGHPGSTRFMGPVEMAETT